MKKHNTAQEIVDKIVNYKKLLSKGCTCSSEDEHHRMGCVSFETYVASLLTDYAQAIRAESKTDSEVCECGRIKDRQGSKCWKSYHNRLFIRSKR